MQANESLEMVCRNCGKVITPNMEIEYSGWFCSVFCCPDCALVFYFNQAGSNPVEYEEAKQLMTPQRKECL